MPDSSLLNASPPGLTSSTTASAATGHSLTPIEHRMQSDLALVQQLGCASVLVCVIVLLAAAAG